MTHTYNLSNPRDTANQYMRTINEIGEFIITNNRIVRHIKLERKNMESVTFAIPEVPIPKEYEPYIQ